MESPIFSQVDLDLLAKTLTEQGSVLEHQAYRVLSRKYPADSIIPIVIQESGFRLR